MELRSEKTFQWILASIVVFSIVGALYYFRMAFLLKAFLVLNCFALIGSILLQAGKGGGLAAIGGLADQTAFGTKTSTFLAKLTYFIGVVFLASTICLTKLSSVIIVEEAVKEERASPVMPAEHPPLEKAPEGAHPPIPQPEAAKETSPALGWQETQTQGEKPKEEAAPPSAAQQNPPQANQQ
jgi:protein translocase SecG subunit